MFDKCHMQKIVNELIYSPIKNVKYKCTCAYRILQFEIGSIEVNNQPIEKRLLSCYSWPLRQ